MVSTQRSWMPLDAAGGRRLAVSVVGEHGIPFVWGHPLQCSMHTDDVSGVFDWRTLDTVAQVIRYDARAHGESCDERRTLKAMLDAELRARR